MHAYAVRHNKLSSLGIKLAWRDHVKSIHGLAQEVLSDLAKDESMKMDPSRHKYAEFLTGLSKKLELVVGSDAIRPGRPHSSSEDNICLSNKYLRNNQ